MVTKSLWTLQVLPYGRWNPTTIAALSASLMQLWCICMVPKPIKFFSAFSTMLVASEFRWTNFVRLGLHVDCLANCFRFGCAYRVYNTGHTLGKLRGPVSNKDMINKAITRLSAICIVANSCSFVYPYRWTRIRHVPDVDLWWKREVGAKTSCVRVTLRIVANNFRAGPLPNFWPIMSETWLAFRNDSVAFTGITVLPLFNVLAGLLFCSLGPDLLWPLL
jgi:hypothetical protein